MVPSNRIIFRTGSYFIAISGSFIIALVAFILFKTNYGSIYKSEFILQFIFEKNSEQKEALYLDTFKQYCNSSTLLNSEMSGDNKKLKLTFDIMLKEEKQINDFIMEVSKLPGVSETSLVSTKNDIDY